MINDSLLQSLHSHLAWWGLRQFTSDETYFQWQRETLSPAEITALHRQVEQKRSGSSADEVSFYDATAHPNILPVLYSQQYDYYLAIGPRVADRIGEARSILDVGCGVGILTTFYARQYPDKTFVGIDRSPASIARAQEQAKALGLTNVQFECLDLDHTPPTRSSDLILATHALVQAEQDPGIPSRSWNTFERARDESAASGLRAANGDRHQARSPERPAFCTGAHDRVREDPPVGKTSPVAAGLGCTRSWPDRAAGVDSISSRRRNCRRWTVLCVGEGSVASASLG